MMIKDIEGYEGLYQITEKGEVWSVKRKIFLKQQTDKDGYKRVSLYRQNGYKMFFVHRLVALAFVPNPENKPTVNHLDEDKTNNHYTNLTWATMKEQNTHGTRLSRVVTKNSRPVRCIETGVVYPSIKAAAEAIGGYTGCITRACQTNTRTHLGYHWEYVKNENKK